MHTDSNTLIYTNTRIHTQIHTCTNIIQKYYFKTCEYKICYLAYIYVDGFIELKCHDNTSIRKLNYIEFISFTCTCFDKKQTCMSCYF